jgi:hypothetical protein
MTHNGKWVRREGHTYAKNRSEYDVIRFLHQCSLTIARHSVSMSVYDNFSAKNLPDELLIFAKLTSVIVRNF